MTPDLYAIQYASASDEVLKALNCFVTYVRKGPVMALLPQELQGLYVRDAVDVEYWQSRLEQVRLHPAVLSASTRFWVEELDEMVRMARRRLKELQATGSDFSSTVSANARHAIHAHQSNAL